MSLYYSDENVTLYHGDSRAIAPTLTADAAIVDPPYGDTSLTWDTWPAGWVSKLPDVDSVWCFGSMRMFLDNAHEFTTAGFKYGQEIVWEKHNGSGFHSDRFRRVHEFAVHFYRGQWADVHHDAQYVASDRKETVRRKGRPTPKGGADKGTYTSTDGGPSLMRSVIPVRSMHGRALHPTEKPVGILTPLIRYSCPIGGTVLDMFAGSGSTLVAATQEGRKSIGIEIDEKYCEIAATRLSQGTLDLGAIA